MMALLQRVRNAAVEIEGSVTARIGPGILILLGIEQEEDAADAEWLAGKIARLRIFADEAGVMNLSVQETAGEVLVVSQFTLHASTKKGNRPSYIGAARPELAVPLYESFVGQLRGLLGPNRVQTGRFGASMQIHLVNDGPVTIPIDSRRRV
ncbi:MAG TPA: D-aminoacyl-tRNA deacylase [Verrucomicrobiales bacterium]|nr:D-aminoacyl-tRNA deacylase [Verrucomicrobiales bacterium]